MAILIRRANPIRLRRFHLTRSLLRDWRFTLSVSAAVIAACASTLIIFHGGQIRSWFHEQSLIAGSQLAQSGHHAGWHTYTDRTDRFAADFPCFAFTDPHAHPDTSPFGPLSVRMTGCYYSVGDSNESFAVAVSPFPSAIPSDAAGQSALLQQTAEAKGGDDATLSATTLNGRPAVAKHPFPNGRQYYTFGEGNLYVITYLQPAGAPNIGGRFFASFRPLN